MSEAELVEDLHIVDVSNMLKAMVNACSSSTPRCRPSDDEWSFVCFMAYATI
jgi:hypothetical protein